MIWEGQPITVTAFGAVVGTHLGPLLAQAVKDAAEGLYGADADERHVSVEDAGKLLETALVPLFRQGQTAPELALRSGTIITGSDRVALNTNSVALHPLLKDWAAPRLEGWLAWQIAAGAFLLHAIPNMPDDYVEVRDEGGRVGAHISLQFPGNVVSAVLSYGEDPIPHMLAAKVGVSGQRLRAIGADLRNLTAPSPQPKPDVEDDEEAASASLERSAETASAIRH
jgi:hypothetical protein